MKRLIFAAAAVVALGAGQATAEGLPSKGSARGAAAGPNWNGFYVGVGIGGGTLEADDVFTVDVGTPDVPPEAIRLPYDSGSGLFGTIAIGYDRAIAPGWVAGVLADYDFGSSISAEAEGRSVDHNHSWSVGGRLGFLAGPSTLVYGTGGYTQAELDRSGLGAFTFNGYFVGAGFETFLRENWTLKLEYRYSKFEDETVLRQEFEGGATATLDLDADLHSARAVLSYRFGDRH
jgi:outer membrane immunogenic protein